MAQRLLGRFPDGDIRSSRIAVALVVIIAGIAISATGATVAALTDRPLELALAWTVALLLLGIGSGLERLDRRATTGDSAADPTKEKGRSPAALAVAQADGEVVLPPGFDERCATTSNLMKNAVSIPVDRLRYALLDVALTPDSDTGQRLDKAKAYLHSLSGGALDAQEREGYWP